MICTIVIGILGAIVLYQNWAIAERWVSVLIDWLRRRRS